ncbi:hypothetical protein H1R20_g7775, partial [Candolleomyces eurysporus]
MTGRSLTERVKKLKCNRLDLQRLKEAATAYHNGTLAGKKQSLRAVANRFKVSKLTLQRYINGKGRTMLEFNATKQKLTNAEEDLLVRFILESADRGFPLRHREVKQYANVLRSSRLGVNSQPVSQAWIYSLNPEAVKSWFDIVEEFIVKAGIPPENIYGMDESGFPTAYSGKERVVGGRGTRTQHKQGGADRENVTAVVTICADGSSIRPLLIFKGKNIKEAWVKGNDVDVFITCSDHGWTDGNIGRRWLKDVFEPETREKARGQPRVLLLDGHSSHYTVEFIEYAIEHNIIVLGYPAHCTHALQGLDVVCFARMKENWKQEIVNYEDTNFRPVDKNEFTYLFSRAYKSSFIADNIKAAFRVTGVHPFSRDMISEAQMKPSLTTSTKGTFPMPQPSPVHAVMAAFSANRPTNTIKNTCTTPPCTPSL